MTSSSNVFHATFVSVVNFSYWSEFLLNIIHDSGVRTIFFYKELNRNSGSGNTSVWVLLKIWRLGRVRDTKFGTNFSDKMLLNAARCQGNSFKSFWVNKGNPTGGVKLPLFPQIRVNQVVTLKILKLSFFDMIKKWRETSKYLENENSF